MHGLTLPAQKPKKNGNAFTGRKNYGVNNVTETTFPSVIDSSMLTARRACKRKHYWGALRSLYPRGQSVHLIAGGALAAGIEAARRACFASETPSTVPIDVLLEAALPPFARHWGDYVPDERSAKTFENTFNALAHYLENYHPGSDDLQPYRRPDGSPAVEYRFAIPLESLLHPETNEPLFFAGRFDMVGMLGGFSCVVDEKTTGSLGFDWASKWDLRGQFLGYCWALRQQGITCSHAVINGIAILKTKNEVQRAIVKYPEYMLHRWEALMRNDIAEMIQDYKLWRSGTRSLERTYPFNFGDSCDSYGGCAFGTLCKVLDPEPFTTGYIKHRYNPVEVNPVEEVS